MICRASVTELGPVKVTDHHTDSDQNYLVYFLIVSSHCQHNTTQQLTGEDKVEYNNNIAERMCEGGPGL